MNTKKQNSITETPSSQGGVIKCGIKYRIGSCGVRTTLNNELTIGSITLPYFYNVSQIGVVANKI